MQLGLGAAAITRFCHQVLRMRTTAVELNPAVIARLPALVPPAATTTRG